VGQRRLVGVAWRAARSRAPRAVREPAHRLRSNQGHVITGATGDLAGALEDVRARPPATRRTARPRPPKPPASPKLRADGQAVSQRVTARDVSAGQVRFPRAAKRLFPPERAHVDAVLRGLLYAVRGFLMADTLRCICFGDSDDSLAPLASEARGRKMLPEAGRSRSSASSARVDGAPTQHDARDQAYQRDEQHELGEAAAAVGADAEHLFDPVHGFSPLNSSTVRDGLQVQ
jgi:hypothetical protein